ncbi:MAG TPA: DUF805 domain-containing protein [Rhizomicrobium sp.]
MSLLHYLFGFSGRINRAKQWAVLLISLAHNIILGIAFSFTVGFSVFIALFQKKTTLAAVIATPQAHMFGVIFCVLFVIGIYVGIAVATKRLHDRDKSMWWVLVFFVLPLVLNVPAILHLSVMFAYLGEVMRTAQEHIRPPPQPIDSPLVILTRGAATIVSLWAFVELYILRGTVGDNRYGPDPLAGRG